MIQHSRYTPLVEIAQIAYATPFPHPTSRRIQVSNIRETGTMLDWDHLQSFLAISRHGNLSAAARALRVTQTTMGRRLEALHAQAGVRLRQKTPEGFVLTQAGERVLASVERIEIEALSVERAITGEDERIAGEVRITTVDSFGARVVIPILQRLSERQPELQIELIADNRSLSLLRREARGRHRDQAG